MTLRARPKPAATAARKGGMVIWICLALAVGALYCIPDPGQRTPELWGIPVILLLFTAGMLVFVINRNLMILRAIFDAWHWAWRLWWRWRR